MGRMLPIPFDRLNSFARNNYNKNIENAQNNYRGNRKKIYLVNDTVMCKNYSTGDAWVPGIILKSLSPVTYLVDVGNSIVWKRHVNQIIDRGISESVKAEILNDELYENVDNSQHIEQKGLLEDGNDKTDSITISPVSTETIVSRSGRIIKPPERLNL
jgi:hypothetical protein